MGNRTPVLIQIPLPIEGQTFAISLTKGYETIVDAIDADLSQSRWYAGVKDGVPYAWTKYGERLPNGQKRTLQLHRVILSRMLGRDLLTSELVDHANRDTLDNRRSNLRLASKMTNAQNSKVSSRNKLGIKGVYQGNGNFYIAEIKVNKKRINLGCHRTAIEAGAAYNAAAVKYFGEFALLNDIQGWEQIAAEIESRTVGINNTSGFTGVRKARDKWLAFMTIKRKLINLGLYDTPEEAHEIYKEAKRKLNNDT